MAPQAKPGILDTKPYSTADNKVEGSGPRIYLASNENPLGASQKAVEAIKSLSESVHRYPEDSSLTLRLKIAEKHALDPNRVLCGNGSDEIISLLTRAFVGSGDEVLYSQHGFLMYAISTRLVGATPVAAPEIDLRADIDGLLSRVSDTTRLVFLANPNNPTGSYLSRNELFTLANALPAHVLLVIDAAYAEYVEADDYTAGVDLVDAFPNVIMMRTFSKIFGLAALRLGWCYGSSRIISILNRVRGPFNVNAIAQAAGLAALDDEAHLEQSRDHNRIWRSWLLQELQRLKLEVRPSVGNFLLVKIPDTEAALLYLRQNNVIVRGMHAYGLPDYMRVTIGTEEELRIFVRHLEAYLRKLSMPSSGKDIS